jgi:NitT/TauT family transport system substrate-binding protein
MTMQRRTFLQLSATLATSGLAPSAHAADPSQTLTVGYIPIIPMTQLFIMVGESWAKDAGLDLKLTRFSSGPAMVEALMAGTLDVAYIGIGPAMLARARGSDIKVVAANVIDQVSLIGRGRLAEIFPAATSPAEAFSRFRETGRPAKIATLPRGSVPETVLRYYLSEVARVPPADVEILGVGEDEVQQMLLDGAVDAASIVEPILTVALTRDTTARIIAPARTMLPHQPGAVVVVTATAIASRRAAIAKLVTLHVKATRFVGSNPREATVDLVAFVGKNLDRTLMRAALTSDRTQLIADPHAIVESTGILQTFQQRIGTQPAVVDIDQFFDFSFYDKVAGKP